MVFVYWMENHPAYAPRVDHILQSMLRRADSLCASHLSIGEVSTGPIKHRKHQLASLVEGFFDSGFPTILPFDRRASSLFAQLRATAHISPADAIHLACAGSSGVDLFLTHDKRLHKIQVPGIQFIAGLDTNLF